MSNERSRTTINDLLEAAQRRLARLDPAAALKAMSDGAIVFDIRSDGQCARDGVIPPASGHSDPSLGFGFDRQLIVVCDEGYQSSLTAATLQDLGFGRASDIIGGCQAWRATGVAGRVG